MEIELKIFTLNCWGIPVISKNRKARMQAIAELLATSDYDVVCLQEVWTASDFKLISEKASGVFPFSHYFHSGVVGSGLCILSRYPFKGIFFHQWPVNGYVHKLQHGDWFGGKGVGLCKIKVNGFNVNIYSAHFHAEYNPDCDEYQAHRILQAYDTAQFIQLTSGGADLTVLAGDLNTEPGDLAYRVLTSASNLTDAFIEAEEDAQLKASTHENLNNSYTADSLKKKECPGKRIDYIMYSSTSNVEVCLKKYYQPLPDRVPHCLYSYSDHEAIAVILSVKQTETPSKTHNRESYRNILEECIDICEQAIKRLVVHKRVYLLFTVILLILIIVTIVFNPPFDYPFIFHILRVILTGLMCFTLIMGTLWNKIENNAVVAAKLTMEVNLRQLIHQNSCR